MAATRQIPSCPPDELKEMSLVDRMLEIQRDYAEPDLRSESWFQRLECLFIHPNKENVLVRATTDPVNLDPRDFVAVSYSFKSAYESLEKSTLNLEVHDSEGRFIKRIQTRDIVLQRVIRYAKAVGTRYFWIDQECFDQDNPDERQAAMDSMDLVYLRSDYPVALLEIVLGPREIDLMNLLMEIDVFAPRHSSQDMNDTINMLRHVQQDRWWTRAWTLHEEYLAGPEMKLLIRHESRAGDYTRSELTRIQGEVCVSGTEFRSKVEKCLREFERTRDRGLRHWSRAGSPGVLDALQDECKSLLHTFRSRTVASSVFEDLERRDLSESYDFIPIVANMCGYHVRLRSDGLAKSASHSVDLCALIMYLMNGEILYNNTSMASPTAETGLSEYLNAISLGSRTPLREFEGVWSNRPRGGP
jgi:hypothetical protein